MAEILIPFFALMGVALGLFVGSCLFWTAVDYRARWAGYRHRARRWAQRQAARKAGLAAVSRALQAAP